MSSKSNLPFIRDGRVVYDATPEERQAARQSRFPGTGRFPNGQPAPRRRRSGELVMYAVSGSDDPPEPPGDGSTTVSAQLAPAFTFISTNCNLPRSAVSALRLLPLIEALLVEHEMRCREARRRRFICLLHETERVPLLIPPSVFRPDPNFQDSDIGSRAIVELMGYFDLASGIKVLRSTLLTIATYRRHPLALNLTHLLHGAVARGQRLQLSFPAVSGEVMYVITTSYEVIIAARSGHQRDLPHPTLIGGDDPEALSAGLIFFRNGRITKVFINASGHFKPNDLSSIEVSLKAFSVLPAEAFDPHFEGFQVFRHGGHFMIDGPVPSGGSQFNPFEILDGPDARGTTESTRAMENRGSMQDLLGLAETDRVLSAANRKEEIIAEALQHADIIDGRCCHSNPLMTDVFGTLAEAIKKKINGLLFATLTSLKLNPVLAGLMTVRMRSVFFELFHLMATTDPGQRKAVLGKNAAFKKLVDDLVLRFFEFL
jgi:hypothetical protein